jgi:predicted DNA-binding transcriptional regulator YafY
VNRTDRLYALVEELRAVTPRPRSARWLADRFEVSSRTVERDIGALQQAGVPIYAEPGRKGGYILDKARTLPPVNVTPAEAVAIAVALEGLRGTPFHDAARAALHKVLAVMPAGDAHAAQELVSRVGLLGTPSAGTVPGAVSRAVSARRVLRFGYRDRNGVRTDREIEPLGYLGGLTQWYLIGWCRLRGSIRCFRLDRILDPVATDEVITPREVDLAALEIPHDLRTPALAY